MAYNTFHWPNEHGESSSPIGTYMATNQIHEGMHYVNHWGDNNDYGYYLPPHYHPGLGDHENQFYENHWNAINPVADFQPQQTEMKPSLEDLVNAFIKESRASYSKNAITPVADFQPQQIEMKPSLEDLINDFMQDSQSRMARQDDRLDRIDTTIGNLTATMKSLETQIGQIASSSSNANRDSFPSNTENPRQHCNAVMLRSGRELESPMTKTRTEEADGKISENNLSKARHEAHEKQEDCVADDESFQYLVEHCNENSISQDIVDTGETMEHVLALEEQSKEQVSNKVKPLEEESSVEEVRDNLELKQMPKSLRYEVFGIDLFFPMISSSSFAGVGEEKPLQVQDHAGMEMKLHNENTNCFKIDKVDKIFEEYLGKFIDNTEAIEYENQLDAPEKFPKPIRRFKEPVHRKAKFPFKE